MTTAVNTVPLSGARKAELMAVTSWVMTVSTFQLFVGVVLAASLIEDLGLSRWQIGVLGAVNTGVGAALAPFLGRVTDRLGARRSTVLVVLVSAVALASTALAFSYWMLVVASVVAGIPQGAGNTVTNKVIAEEVPTSEQGSVTGVKQSGVQVAVFLSGAMLPTSSATIGWRPALALFAVFTSLTALAIRVRFPPSSGTPKRPRPQPERESGDAPDADAPSDDRSDFPATARAQDHAGPGSAAKFVRSVAVYAFLLGMAAAGVTRFYPLFSQEVLGFSETTAGFAVSVTGLTAIAARLLWGAITDRFVSSATALRILAAGGSATALLLVAAERLATWLLWPAVVLAAFTVVAWNVVAMLAVIRMVPSEDSGRATGVVLFGFLGGLTVAAPVVGFAVDRVGSYQPAWIVLGLLALLGAFVVRPAVDGRRGTSSRSPLALRSGWPGGRARR